MARIPIEEGFFRIPDDPAELPRLLGSHCPSCGEVFFPRRLVCAQCLYEGCEDVELSTRGRLWTWTYCHVPLFGKKDADVPGYGVGQVDLGLILKRKHRITRSCSAVPTTSRSGWSSRSTSRRSGRTRTVTRS